MSEEIIKILDYLSEKFGIVFDKADNELFPYIKEIGDKLINYEICTSIVWIVVSVIAIILLTVITIKLFKKTYIEKNYSDDGEFWFPIFIFFLCVAIVAFSGAVITQIFDIAECVTCPEKYILDYIMNYSQNK